jgi:hypothetical protein
MRYATLGLLGAAALVSGCVHTYGYDDYGYGYGDGYYDPAPAYGYGYYEAYPPSVIIHDHNRHRHHRGHKDWGRRDHDRRHGNWRGHDGRGDRDRWRGDDDRRRGRRDGDDRRGRNDGDRNRRVRSDDGGGGAPRLTRPANQNVNQGVRAVRGASGNRDNRGGNRGGDDRSRGDRGPSNLSGKIEQMRRGF